MARFNRLTAMAMFSAVAAIMRSDMAHHIKQQQVQKLGPYVSRGKGGRKQPRTFSGVARARREAKKARNASR